MTELLTVTATSDDGRKVKLSAAQAQAIQTLNVARKGGCAAVSGYVPSTNWIVPPIQDIQLLTNFSTEKLYKRRIAALQEITFADVSQFLAADEKLANTTMAECRRLFEDRHGKMVATLEKTLEGDRTDAHRQGHDRCYVHIGGVKVNLVTEKVDGLQQPVVDRHDGTVRAKTVMVKYLELNVKTRQKGQRKTVNSGAPVRMGNLIEKTLNKRSVGFRTLSLKEDNFESFKIDRREILPGEIEDFRDLLLG